MGVAACTSSLGDVARVQGEYEQAERHYRDAIAQLRALGARSALAVSENNLGLALLRQGRYREARDVLEAGAHKLVAIGRRSGQAWAAAVLLPCYAALGDWATWDDTMVRAQALLEETGYIELDIALMTELAGEKAQAADHPERATAAYRLALSQWRGLGREREASAIERRLSR